MNEIFQNLFSLDYSYLLIDESGNLYLEYHLKVDYIDFICEMFQDLTEISIYSRHSHTIFCV